ncbi:MAG: hypothetical protein D4R45_02940, partial [Planctomycetaceae bacterium]
MFLNNMRTRDITICFCCVLICFGFLYYSGSKIDSINSAREEMNLVINEPLENAPPALAFATVAMGAFRGLVVDILWIRADALKMKGQFFDAKQTAEWITTLQPRFDSVWDFQSWNMAYNISAAIPADQPEERWRWVKNGYELLRDEGIPRNPKSMKLYRSLGFIFQHKIGGMVDDAHQYYKLQLALSMKPLLGPDTNEYFRKLAEAPLDLDGILADPEIKKFVEELQATDEVFADKKNFVRNYLSLRQSPSQFKESSFDVIDKYRKSESLEKFDVFAKAYQLRNEWKLEPKLMEKLNLMYGPIDWNDPNKREPLNWEHPDVHSMYWAAKSIEISGNKEYSVAELNLDRMIYFALKDLFRYGNLIIYDTPVETSSEVDGLEEKSITAVVKTVFVRPDLRMFESYNQANLSMIRKYEEMGEDVPSLKHGYRNIVSEALVMFYQAGHKDYANMLYDRLREMYPQRKEFKDSLAMFIRKRLREELQTLDINDVIEMVQMMLQEAYFRYAVRDDDESFGREKMAEEIYGDFLMTLNQSQYRAKTQMPDFSMVRYMALEGFLRDNMYP